MIISCLRYQVNAIYNVVIKKPATNNPIAAIIASIAIKVFAFVAINYSMYIGLGAFAFSLIMDFSLLSNFSKVKENIHNLFLSPKERGEREGRELRRTLDGYHEATKGFFKSLFA